MKRLLPILFVLITCTFATSAQTTPAAAELTRLLNEFLAGAGKNDAAVHDRFWADDLIYTRSAGVRINKEELMKGVRSAPAPKPDDPVTVYTAEDVKVQQYGDAAVVAFRLVSTTTKSDGAITVGNNLNTGTFIKRKGKWQVVAWQSTIVPKAEPAARPSMAEAEKPSVPPTAARSTTRFVEPNRTYFRGPRGGCYYLSSSGKKVYVDHSHCGQ